MQPASENCNYLEELICKEESLKENQCCSNQNQDREKHIFMILRMGGERILSLMMCQHCHY